MPNMLTIQHLMIVAHQATNFYYFYVFQLSTAFIEMIHFFICIVLIFLKRLIFFIIL